MVGCGAFAALSQATHIPSEGTEATAASAMDMATLGPSHPPPILKIDHPFLFVIRDTTTGTFLFVGRVLDPSQE